MSVLQIADSGNTTIGNSRTRFNWGFWDGHADQKAEREPRDVTEHFDPVYAAGYLFGNRDADENPTKSDEAWAKFLDAVEVDDPALAGELAAAADAVAL